MFAPWNLRGTLISIKRLPQGSGGYEYRGALMAGKRSGFGSVEQLQSGKWRARYKVEGQILNAPRTFANKTDAQLPGTLFLILET